MPVYNAEDHLERSIQSCFAQEEVDEVIAVDDGSSDNSMAVLRHLQADYPSLCIISSDVMGEDMDTSVHTHKDTPEVTTKVTNKVTKKNTPKNTPKAPFSEANRGYNSKNYGPGFARNQGIKASRNEWLAFLDADDVMLPNRFKKTVETIQKNPNAEGIHECIGVEFTSSAAETLYRSMGKPIVTGVKKNVEPDELLYTLIHAKKHGYFSLDGFTVHRNALKKSGLFFSTRYAEDVTLIARIVATSRIFQGDPANVVATRVFHGKNSIASTSDRIKTEPMKSFLHLLEWWSKNLSSHNMLLQFTLMRLAAYETEPKVRETVRSYRKKIRASTFHNRLLYHLIQFQQYKRIQNWKTKLTPER